MSAQKKGRESKWFLDGITIGATEEFGITKQGAATIASLAATGNVSGVDGTFTGNLSAVDGTFTGDLNHATAGAKVGFYGTTPIVKQTGVAVSAAGIHAALVNLGLIAA